MIRFQDLRYKNVLTEIDGKLVCCIYDKNTKRKFAYVLGEDIINKMNVKEDYDKYLFGMAVINDANSVIPELRTTESYKLQGEILTLGEIEARFERMDVGEYYVNDNKIICKVC